MKINDRQRDMLLAVRLGCVTQHKSERAYEEPWFRVSYSVSGCPRIESETATGRALLRRGLIEPVTPENRTREARLTPEGMAIAEPMLTDEHRKALQHAEVMRQHQAERERQRARRLAWEDANRAELDRLRERANDRAFEDHSLKCRLTEIAVEISDGANNVDDLLKEMREIGAKRRRIAEEEAADEAVKPRYEEKEAA